MLHAKLQIEWIRSTSTRARETSMIKLYFISEADSPLKFIEQSVFKSDQIRSNGTHGNDR